MFFWPRKKRSQMSQQNNTRTQQITRRRFLCPIHFTMWLPDDVDLNPFTGIDWQPLPDEQKVCQQ